MVAVQTRKNPELPQYCCHKPSDFKGKAYRCTPIKEYKNVTIQAAINKSKEYGYAYKVTPYSTEEGYTSYHM